MKLCHQTEALPPLPSGSGTRNSLNRSSSHRCRRKVRHDDDNNAAASCGSGGNNNSDFFDLSNHTSHTNSSHRSNDSETTTGTYDEVNRLSTEIEDIKKAMKVLKQALDVVSLSPNLNKNDGNSEVEPSSSNDGGSGKSNVAPPLFSPGTNLRKASWAELGESFQWDSDGEKEERRSTVKEKLKEQRLARLQRAIELQEERRLKEEEAKMEKRLDILQARKAQRIAKAKAKATKSKAVGNT